MRQKKNASSEVLVGLDSEMWELIERGLDYAIGVNKTRLKSDKSWSCRSGHLMAHYLLIARSMAATLAWEIARLEQKQK